MIWPASSELDSYYGNPRGPDGKLSLKWEAQNIVRIEFPWDAVLAWDTHTRARAIRVHRLCSASLDRVLRAIWAASGRSQTKIVGWGMHLYGGGFEFRPMRGSSRLSVHAYGAAVDFDPVRNALGDRTPNFAGIPEVRKAFADEGWRWGGDWDRDGLSSDEARPDGMHWEAVR